MISSNIRCSNLSDEFYNKDYTSCSFFFFAHPENIVVGRLAYDAELVRAVFQETLHRRERHDEYFDSQETYQSRRIGCQNYHTRDVYHEVDDSYWIENDGVVSL